MEVIITYLTITVIRRYLINCRLIDESETDGTRSQTNKHFALDLSSIEPVYCSIHDNVGTYHTISSPRCICTKLLSLSMHPPRSVSPKSPSLAPLLSFVHPRLFIPGTVLRYFRRVRLTPAHPSTQVKTRILSRGAKERTPVGRATQSGTQMEYIFCFIRKRLANLSICNVSRRSCTPNRIDLLHL